MFRTSYVRSIYVLCLRDLGVYTHIYTHMGVFVTKGFFASFSLTDILLTPILISFISLPSFFADNPVVVRVGLYFMDFMND